MSRKPIILEAGQEFGRWIVKGLECEKKGSRYYRCQCVCGKEGVVVAYSLTRGDSESCGCLANELLVARSKADNKIHGMSRGQHKGVYHVWVAMRNRCFNERDGHYPRWGGRGIKPCAWLAEDPRNLLALLGERAPGMSLERVDNDGGYWCGACEECNDAGRACNVKWATNKEQSNNRRSRGDARVYEAFGDKKTLKQWAASSGVSRGSLRHRVRDMGWSMERALTETPPKGAAAIKR